MYECTRMCAYLYIYVWEHDVFLVCMCTCQVQERVLNNSLLSKSQRFGHSCILDNNNTHTYTCTECDTYLNVCAGAIMQEDCVHETALSLC